MKVTGWSKGLDVSADGEGVVSHAGLVLLRQLADKGGLTGGLSGVLASERLLIHDRGRVMADLACAIAEGSTVISDFRVLADQKELCGQVASVPTTWRTLSEIVAGGSGAGADQRGGECCPAPRVGGGRGPPRRAARGEDRGPGAGGGDLRPVRRHGHCGALG